MAKGHGRHRKKETHRSRDHKKAAPVLPVAPTGPHAPATGLEATRGPVSNAFRSWVHEYARRQAQATAEQFNPVQGRPIPADLFVLAPLSSRTVGTPRQEMVSVQMGLPLLPTRQGSIAPAPDRLAVIVLLIPQDEPSNALASLGLGQQPELPQPVLLFAVQLAAESMRAARAADALAWYLARLIESGDIDLSSQQLGDATGEMMALLRPAAAPSGARRADPAQLESYEGYGVDCDEPVVPLDVTAAPARGGLSGLPTGAFLKDSGEPLTPLLADLRDYVVGLWPFEYFKLEALTAAPSGTPSERTALLSSLSELVRQLDELLGQTAEAMSAALAQEGQPPAWIAEETASYRTGRETLRSTRVAQEMIPLLGPLLFDLEIPPEDYLPEEAEEDDEDDEEE